MQELQSLRSMVAKGTPATGKVLMVTIFTLVFFLVTELLFSSRSSACSLLSSSGSGLPLSANNPRMTLVVQRVMARLLSRNP